MLRRWEDGSDVVGREEKKKEDGHEDGMLDGRDEKDETEVKASEGTAAPGSRKKRRHVLNDQHLVGKQGFQYVYESFPQQLATPAPGMEAKALNDLISCYKEWAYELYPGLAFEDFVDRTESISKKQAVSSRIFAFRY